MLRNLRDSNASLSQFVPSATSTLSRIITQLLDYLSVEELQCTADESATVFRGNAKFGGEGRANPELPSSQSITSAGGQKISWLDHIIAFRLTIPRRSSGLEFDSSGLSGTDQDDILQLNELLNKFGDIPAGQITDVPGSDFRLELLIRGVRIILPRDKFIPARIGADGWLEPDPNFKEVVLELPRIALTLEQHSSPGNLDLSFKSWDLAGFDEPGDVDTARFFTLTPPLFLHSSRYVGFGIESIVADFSNDITPPEILEQFGIGDDFNGIWMPLVRIFIAPGRTTGLALSARGQDMLYDFDKGFSGEIAIDILNRGGQLVVQPVFYSLKGNSPLTWNRGKITSNSDGTTDVSEGKVDIPGEGEMHLSIRGSISPYQVNVLQQDSPSDPNTLFTPDTSDGTNRPKWRIPESGIGMVTIDVSDNGNHNSWHETIEIKHVSPTRPGQADEPHYESRLIEGAGDPDFHIIKDEGKSREKVLVLRLVPEFPLPVLKKGSEVIHKSSDGTYETTLTPGEAPAEFVATWQNSTLPPVPENLDSQQQGKLITETPERDIRLYFRKRYPLPPPNGKDDEISEIVKKIMNKSKNFTSLIGTTVDSNGILGGDVSEFLPILDDFLKGTQGKIMVFGFASHEISSNFEFNLQLSINRSEILRLLIHSLDPSRQIEPKGYDNIADSEEGSMDSDQRFRVAIATAAQAITLIKSRHATAELTELPRPPIPPAKHPPEASEPERPTIFRRIGFRFRFERGDPVLGEISGELDFRLQAEEAAGFIKSRDPRNNTTPSNIANAVTTPSSASQSGEQGILDYRLTISYDTATRRLTEALVLGFDQQARDGWVHVGTFSPTKLADTIGSLLVFAPLLNSGIDSTVNAQADESRIVNIIVAGAEVVIATSLGIFGALKFRKLTLFGIELTATELLPDDETEEKTRFGNISVLIDYAVDFEVDINLGVLTVRSNVDSNGDPIPIRVRYRGFGFRLAFQDAHTYQPVFDTSKGFEFGLADPGSLEIGGPLGPILQVNSVKVNRQNPLVLEMDLGLNVNLGVLSVETVRVRIPLEAPHTPTIIPTGISVNIPGTIVGSGFLDIRDSGVTGAIDLTLVPVKIRVQASAGLENFEEGNRRITAFFLGLGAEFPAPIPLLNSGLGIYGLLGLFGMHYRRDEDPPLNPNLPIALDWYYNKAKGEPHLTAVEGRPTWVVAPDRWSFGMGMVLGTMEGAFILNLKGMLVLELPGPRILIFAKADILKPRPPAGKPADQSAGMLAVVDLNLQAGYIAIGLIFRYEIKELLKVEVPIDTKFDFDDVEDWHLNIGSLHNKASAEILGIAKGTSYLMFDGNGIPEFPIHPLDGFSIAAGIEASLVLGDESSGLYAKVTGSLDAGVSNHPFHFFGRMYLEGRLHLWVVGLGVSAQLDIDGPEPIHVRGEVCGEIDLWLTDIEGCVDVEIGQRQPLPNPEDLITGLSLQSHSAVLTEGQATDQPIDTSIGISHRGDEIVPDIPIDAIPVLQMKFPPVFGAGTIGLKPSSSAPTLSPGSDGWFSLGGLPGEEGEREARYEIQSITISPALPGGITDIPVTWWQPARANASADSQATDKGVNLAVNSWIPVPFPRAYHRSEEQRQTIRDRFEIICRQIAPACSVLWTFNAHFTVVDGLVIRNHDDPFPGYSKSGWLLNGLAWPDPPGSKRSSTPETRLHIHEPDYQYRTDNVVQEYTSTMTGRVFEPAKVVPAIDDGLTGQALQLPFLQFFTGMKDQDSLSPEIKNLVEIFLSGAGVRERIELESGDVSEVRALICANEALKVVSHMFIRAFNNDNEIVEERKLPGLFISTFGNLPISWQDPTGPWFDDVKRVFEFFELNFMQPETRTHHLFLVDWKPAASISRFEIFYKPAENSETEFLNPPPVMLGVIETLSRKEAERVSFEQHYQQEMVEVVVKSLEEGDKRPLFAPDTLYTVTTNYRGTIRKGNDHSISTSPPQAFSQEFKFHTATQPPKRLNPWMLSTLPENDEKGHFSSEKVQFIFNDASVIQIFQAFGKELRTVLRKANGNHQAEEPRIDLQGLHAVEALLLSPYAQTMREVAKEMTCMPHIIETEQHQVFTVDISLERGTDYIMDIESVPRGAAEDPMTPLFRMSFSTSRFESAGELATLIGESNIRERPLKSELTLPFKTKTFVVPDDTTQSRTSSVDIWSVTDAEMEASLLAALGSDVPPANHPAITLLWSAGTPAKPVAVLIDAPEAIMRLRPVPIEVRTPTPDDDVIQHFQIGQQLWLELVENGSVLVERIIYATGGCRALIFLKESASGALRLSVRKYRHLLLTADTLLQDFPLITMTLPSRAPWEA